MPAMLMRLLCRLPHPICEYYAALTTTTALVYTREGGGGEISTERRGA
jgi:hypothetical protein